MKTQPLKLAAAFLFAAALTVLPAAADEAPYQGGTELPSPNKLIVKVTDKGLVPSTITLDKLDSSVFFVNTTNDSLVTVAVDFGSHEGHCASGNLKFENGVMHSVEPIGPKDFAVTCFPQAGTYNVKVEGIGGRKAPVTGKIVVLK